MRSPLLVRRRVAVAACFFANGALLASWVSRIPAVQQRFHLTTGALGVLLLAQVAGALVGMPLAGWLGARWGSGRVTLGGLLTTCAAIPLIAAAPDRWLLALALGLFGAGNGATDVSMNSQAVLAQREWGRSIMPSFHALFSTGGIAGAYAGGLCAARGVTLTHQFAGAAALMALLSLAAFPALASPREEAASLAAGGSNPDPAGGAPAADGLLPTAPAGGAAALLRSPALLTVTAITFLSMFGEGAMSDWSAVYLRRGLRATAQLAADGYAAFSLAMTVGRFAGDALTARFGPAALLRACGALAALGLAAALALGGVPATLIGYGCVGAGLSIIVPIAFSAAGDAVPGLAPSAAIAVVSTLGYLGFLVSPPLIGFAAEAVTLRGALALVALAGAAIVLLAGSLKTEPSRGVGASNPIETLAG